MCSRKSTAVMVTRVVFILQEHQVKDGTALQFLLELLCTLKSEKGGAAVTAVIKKSGAENRLMEFFPSNNQQQTEDNFKRVFAERDLPEVVAFRNQVKIIMNIEPKLEVSIFLMRIISMGSVPMKHHVYSTDNCLRNLLQRC